MSEEPVIEVEETPVSVVEEVVTEEPVVAVEDEPVVVAEEPAVVTEEPVVVTDEPVVVAEEESVVVTDEPVVAVEEEPVVVAEEPVVAVEEESVVITEDKPVVVTEEPVVITEEPVVVAEEPAVITDEPVVAEEDPVVVAEESVVITEEPVVVIEDTIVAEEEPVVVITEEPVVAEEEPVVVLDEIYASQSDVLEEKSPQIQSSENIRVEISEVDVNPDSLRGSKMNGEEVFAEPTSTHESNTPTLVFIVPYRDREKHYKLFSSAMKDILVNAPPYKIFYVNQKDTRGFNRGAMKNIGFLAVKNMYPNDYQNITLIFNDIDTMPSKDTILNYETTRGVIKHFYGFDHTLGGIVSINASDFEKLNGFPNFWGWGYEDNLLQTRAKNAGIVIDRSVFYKIFDSHIIHLSDTSMRTVNRADFDRFLQNTNEGIHCINGLNYTVNNETGFIDVLQFNTTVQEVLEKRSEYDLRNGPVPFKDIVMRNRRIPRMKMHF